MSMLSNALQAAAIVGDEEIARLLLEQGADVSAYRLPFLYVMRK